MGETLNDMIAMIFVKLVVFNRFPCPCGASEKLGRLRWLWGQCYFWGIWLPLFRVTLPLIWRNRINVWLGVSEGNFKVGICVLSEFRILVFSGILRCSDLVAQSGCWGFNSQRIGSFCVIVCGWTNYLQKNYLEVVLTHFWSTLLMTISSQFGGGLSRSLGTVSK